MLIIFNHFKYRFNDRVMIINSKWNQVHASALDTKRAIIQSIN